jgi:hypothetical protein
VDDDFPTVAYPLEEKVLVLRGHLYRLLGDYHRANVSTFFERRTFENHVEALTFDPSDPASTALAHPYFFADIFDTPEHGVKF